MDHKKYVSQVRELLRKVDADAPDEFGIEQTTRLTGNALYVAEHDTCWLQARVCFADGSPEIVAWFAIWEDERDLGDPYPGLITTSPMGNDLTELFEGWYQPTGERKATA